MKRILKIFLSILIVLVLVFVGYLAYILISYHRIDDNQELEISSTGSPLSAFTTENEYRISSANLGFGAYSDDYSFFMDGGTQSWAYSKDAVIENITGSIESIQAVSPDIFIFQEVDLNSTRSYHVNQEDLILNLLESQYDSLSYDFAINYDSAFLMYPLTQPHGKSKSGLLTISSANITDSIRRQLPIEEGLSKLIDLDRCYSKSYIPVDNGKQLVIFNVHLSAYTTDPSTAENQIKMLNEDMLSEVDTGNYVITGGDMNKDLLGDSSQYFGDFDYTADWASNFPVELIDDEFTIVGPIDYDNPVPTVRNADRPYSDECFVTTIDGFFVSSNIEVVNAAVIDNQFKYSDHNPVYMDFILK